MGDAGNGLISGTAADDDGEICGGAAVVPGGDLDACGFTDGVVEGIRDGGHTTALRRSGLGQPLGGTPRDVPSGEHLAESRWGGGRFGGEVFVWGGGVWGGVVDRVRRRCTGGRNAGETVGSEWPLWILPQ